MCVCVYFSIVRFVGVCSPVFMLCCVYVEVFSGEERCGGSLKMQREVEMFTVQQMSLSSGFSAGGKKLETASAALKTTQGDKNLN